LILLSDIMNYLIREYELISYLEIGVAAGNTLNNVFCQTKDAVDPVKSVQEVNYVMTSDEFFKQLPKDKMYDLIFIDGLHTYEQVKIDFDNSVKHLSPNGFIVMDDTCPYSEELTSPVFRDGGWTGTVYKFMIDFAYSDIDFEYNTVFTPHGHTIFHRGNRIIQLEGDISYDWNFFHPNKKAILNLISEEEFYTKYQKE